MTPEDIVISVVISVICGMISGYVVSKTMKSRHEKTMQESYRLDINTYLDMINLHLRSVMYSSEFRQFEVMMFELNGLLYSINRAICKINSSSYANANKKMIITILYNLHRSSERAKEPIGYSGNEEKEEHCLMVSKIFPNDVSINLPSKYALVRMLIMMTDGSSFKNAAISCSDNSSIAEIRYNLMSESLLDISYFGSTVHIDGMNTQAYTKEEYENIIEREFQILE